MELEEKNPGNEEELSAATSTNESAPTENNSKQTNLDEQPSSFTLKFITWNTDGYSKTHWKPRTEAVCKIIEKEQADIVFLQEVIQLTADYIAQRLSNYHCYFANKDKEGQENDKDPEDKKDKDEEEKGAEKGGKEDNERSGYFIGTLLKKTSVSIIRVDVIDFPFTQTARNLLKVNVKYKDLPICLLNSHFENSKDFSKERKKELEILFENMLEAPENETVIFGGDTNLREKELIALGGLPSGIEDVWVTCGSQQRCANTFDLYQNDNLKVNWKAACRFDRVFVRRSSPSKLKPVSFELIGLERLSSYGCFPSTHWGILCYFERVDFKFKLDEGFSEDNNDVQILQPYWMKKPQM